MEKYTHGKIVAHAYLVFRETFNDPDQILQMFKTDIRSKIRYLNKGVRSRSELDICCQNFATEVFENMSLISIAIIRDRLSKEMIFKDYGTDISLPSKDEAKYFEHLASDMMKILLSAVYKEKKDANHVQVRTVGPNRQKRKQN